MCLDVQTNKLEAVLLQGHVLQIIILHFVFEKSSEAVIDDIKEGYNSRNRVTAEIKVKSMASSVNGV